MLSQDLCKAFLTNYYRIGLLAVTCLISAGAGAAPNITSTQIDLFVDGNGDNRADPGEQVDYTTTIGNSGDETAGGLVLSNAIPAGTALVAGSVKTTPVARDDFYNSIGNVGISVPNTNGVLANDFDLGPTSLTVTNPLPGVSTLTSQGGMVIFSSEGGFTYTPPTGFNGIDSFSYTVADENGPDLPAPATGANIAAVMIEVHDMIWFVDNSAGLIGNGTLASPFNSLALQNSNPDDNNGDCIFVDAGAGSYGSGLMLQDDQILVGEGSSDTLANSCGITVPAYSMVLPTTSGARPVILNGAGDAISLASSNTVRGLNVGDSLGTGIAGFSFGAASISEVQITTAGMVLDLTNGTLAATFDGITKTASGADGIRLSNVAGNADFGTLSIESTGAGEGVRLAGTGTTNSTFSSVGSITTASGTALDLSDCTLGAMSFASVVSSGGTNTGINLATTAGPLTINGGSISGKLDTDGVRLKHTTGLISLSNFSITDIDGTGDAAPPGAPAATDNGPYSHHSGADGIHGEDVLGGLSLNTVTIERISDNAINGELLTATFNPTFHVTQWNGLTLQDCVFRDSNRYHRGPNQLDDRNSNFIESQVHIHGISGQVTVDNCTFTRGAGLLHLVSAPAGTLRVDVTSSDFSLAQKEMTPAGFFVGGPQTVGGAAIEIYGQGSASLDVIIGDLAETNSALGNVFLNNGAGALGSIRLQSNLSGLTPFTGDYDTVVSRNIFRVTDHLSDANPGSFQGFPQGHVEFLLEGNGVAEAAVSFNTLEQLQGPGDGPAAFTFTTGQGMSAELMLNDNTMDKAWNRIASYQAFSGSQQIVKLENNTYVGDTSFPYTTADDAGYFGAFPGTLPFESQVIRANDANIDFTADNENVVEHDTSFNFFSDRAFDFENFNNGITDVELDNNTPVLGFEFHEASGSSGGTINLYQDLSASFDIATILSANGNSSVFTDNSGGAKVLYRVSSDPTTDPTIIVP